MTIDLSYDAFVSYRRATSAHLAQLVYRSLTDMGCKTFLDLREMPSGPFPFALASVIEHTPNFVPILSPGSLIRKGSAVDYFEKEIEFAFEFGKNIVPLREENLIEDGGDTISMAPSLQQLHQIGYSNSYPDASLEALEERLRYERGAAPTATMFDKPKVISDHHRWGLIGANKAVSFILKSRSHAIEYNRVERPWRFSVEINIDLDGKNIFSRRAFVLKVGTWNWDFYIDDVPCQLETRFRGGFYFTTISVGGVLVLSV